MNDDDSKVPSVKYRRAADFYDALEHHESFASLLHEPFIAVDRFGRILRVAPAVEKLFGYAPTRLVGRRIAHRLHPEDRLTFARALNGARAFEISLTVRAPWDKYEPVKMALLAKSTVDGFGTVLLIKVVRDETPEDRG